MFHDMVADAYDAMATMAVLLARFNEGRAEKLKCNNPIPDPDTSSRQDP